MTTKEQLLHILNTSPDEVWDKFDSAFGYDDWCEALKDFPEAQPIYMKRIGEKQLQTDDWEFNRDPEKQRQTIINAYTVFLRENEGKPLNEYSRIGLGKNLAQRL